MRTYKKEVHKAKPVSKHPCLLQAMQSLDFWNTLVATRGFLFIWNTLKISPGNIICSSVSINFYFWWITDRASLSVCLINIVWLVHSVGFLFNTIDWFGLQSICKFADLLQVVATDALRTFCRSIFCRLAADILQIVCISAADCKQDSSFRTGHVGRSFV